MNKVFKIVFNIYHLVFASNVATCRFTPTCSQYMLDAVNKYGAVEGTYLTLKRIMSCHPLSKRPFLDPA